uniref:RUS family member 1 n=1 Tax=Equus caballus TaxID=9796 RepID=A0A9L0R4S9_HORSE
MADGASLEARLCSEQYGSGAARGCCAAVDGSLQWEAWGWRWWGFSGAFTAKPEGPDGGGEGAPATASAPLSRLLALFLPQGFPDSVSPDYLPYQLWDSVQIRLACWAASSLPGGRGEFVFLVSSPLATLPRQGSCLFQSWLYFQLPSLLQVSRGGEI